MISMARSWSAPGRGSSAARQTHRSNSRRGSPVAAASSPSGCSGASPPFGMASTGCGARSAADRGAGGGAAPGRSGEPRERPRSSTCKRPDYCVRVSDRAWLVAVAEMSLAGDRVDRASRSCRQGARRRARLRHLPQPQHQVARSGRSRLIPLDFNRSQPASLHQVRGHAGLVGSDARGAGRLAFTLAVGRCARRSHILQCGVSEQPAVLGLEGVSVHSAKADAWLRPLSSHCPKRTRPWRWWVVVRRLRSAARVSGVCRGVWGYGSS